MDRVGTPYAWMLDTREMVLQKRYLPVVGRLLWERLEKHDIDFVAGYTLAAHPLAVAVMYASGHTVDGVLIRRSPKENGLCKLVEGPDIPAGARVALVDDLVNSGDTLKQAVAALRPFGCQVVAAGVLIDYELEGAEWLRAEGIALEALFTLAELGVSARAPQPWEPLWVVENVNGGEYRAPKSIPHVGPERIHVGSDRGFMLCFDRSGNELWRYAVRDKERGVHSSPCVREGRVYFGAYDGYLYCVEDGKLVWETRPGQWIGSSPALWGDRLYVGIEYGQSGGGLLCADASTGKRLWEAPAADYMHASPIVDEQRGQAIVGANDNVLRAVDLQDGSVRWEHETGGALKAWASVDADGTCFAGSFDGHLYAVDAATGDLRWRRKLSQNLYCTPVLTGDLVLACGHSGRLVAMDRATGHVRWVAATHGPTVGGPALIGEEVMTTSVEGWVMRFACADGAPLGGYKAGAKMMGAPGVGAGLACVVDFTGKMHAFSV